MAVFLPTILISVLFSFVYLLLRVLFGPPKDFPPGPRGLPFIGAALSIPKEQEWRTYSLWKKRYGPIIGMSVMGNNIVILNAPELVRDLFSNRGVIYGERPIMPMLEMMGLQDWNIGMMQRGDMHTLTRKMMSKSLSSKAISQFKEMQQKEVHRLLVNLFQSPIKFSMHFRTLMITIMMRMFYGFNDDTFVKLHDELASVASLACTPAGYLVNLFPLLRYLPPSFPGTGFREIAKSGRIMADKIFTFPVDVLKTKIAKHEAEPSFLSPYLQNPEQNLQDLFAAQSVAGTAYSAGVETSTSVMLTLILAMLRYPDVQRKAQEEIDRVIPGRLPTFEDIEKLPYVTAVVSECYRWATPAPLGLPRLLTEDDVVMGYKLPRGTIVMANSWALLRDETIYPRATEFIPERFIGNETQPDPREHVYGYGRRACPGRYLADQIIWLSIASLLAAFTISPEKDKEGRRFIPPYDYTTGVMSRPKDFECCIVPRSEIMVRIISVV
ncbi:cytochrome P450 [Cyathus striatus]|nr:cytochrome P450 [Cyathus striatus]